MVSHWRLSDSKSPQVSRTLLSILADLNNVVVSMISTCPLISKSSSLCTNPLEILLLLLFYTFDSVPHLHCPGTNLLVTVPRAPITIGITVTFMFYSFFSFLARFRFLSLFSLSFSFTLLSVGMPKFTIWQVLFFC